MQCPNEDEVRIASFLLGGEAHKWWVMERGMRPHTWKRFKIVFDAQFFPEAYKEAESVEFERLVQGSMFVAKYEKKFFELLEFCPYVILDDDKKMRRFLDGLSDVIASGIFGAAYPTFRSLRDAAFEVERQRIMRGSRRLPYESVSSGTSCQGS